MNDYLNCPDCGMYFKSSNLFDKHRREFCIGAATAPNNPTGIEVNNRPWPSDQIGADIGNRNSYDEKVDALVALKNRKAKQREERDRRLLSGRSDDSRSVASEDERRSIDEQIDRLQAKINENNLLSPGKRPVAANPGGNRTQMSETRSRLSSAKQALEMKRAEISQKEQEIARRLDQLAQGIQPDPEIVPESDLAIARALEQQQDKYNRMIQDLKNEVDDLKNSTTPPIGHEPTAAALGTVRDTKVIESMNLVVDLQGLKRNYLENGGDDQTFLKQIDDTIQEAIQFQAGENTVASGTYRGQQEAATKSFDNDPITQKFMEYELENKRLMQHLEDIRNPRDPETEEMRKMQKQHALTMMKMQQEMEVMKHQAEMVKLRSQLYGFQGQDKEPPIGLGLPMPSMQFSGNAPKHESLGFGNSAPPVIPALPPAPFDPAAGFLIYYDFVLNLEVQYRSVRLVVVLLRGNSEFGTEQVLGLRECQMTQLASTAGFYPNHLMFALVGTEQVISNIQPSENTTILVQVQATNSTTADLETIAWTKILLFDDQLRLISGRWKLPLRKLPVRPETTPRDLNTIPQEGGMELFYRLVNYRDKGTQNNVRFGPQNHQEYQYPTINLNGVGASYIPLNYNSVANRQPSQTQQAFPAGGGGGTSYRNPTIVYKAAGGGSSGRRGRTIGGSLPNPPSMPPPTTTGDEYSEAPPVPGRMRNYGKGAASISGEPIPITLALGYLKNVPAGEAKVRLTMYYRTSGEYVNTPFGPVTMTSRSVLSTYMDNYHMFGKEQVRFDDVTPSKDQIVVARVYLRPQVQPGKDESKAYREESRVLDDEQVVAWGVIPVMTGYGDMNAGTHMVPLYQIPVPEATDMPVEKDEFSLARRGQYRRYGTAELNMSLYTIGSLPRVDEGDSDEDYIPDPPHLEDYADMHERPFIQNVREIPLSQPFVSGQGFDLYIDGARFLPDTVTITRVTGRIFDHRYSDKVVAQSISTGINLDSDIYNPDYNFRVEFRDIAFPPSSTLLVKLYTIDRHTRQLTIIGYAALNIFCESGTHKQPTNDALGTQVSLNEGGHQLRLFHQAPDALRPLSVFSLPERHRYIPCASLLVRIVKAPTGHDGSPLQALRVPQNDHERLGLWVRKPEYSSGFYYTENSEPAAGEKKMFRAMAKRRYVTVRESISLIADGEEKRLGTDQQIEGWIRNHLTRLMDTTPADHTIHHITPYLPHYGFKIACDAAMNLPWSRFTHAMILLNPPAAFYYGGEYARYDRISYTTKLVWDEGIKSPIWVDDFKVFRNRAFNSNLNFIIHLQEIEVKQIGKNYKYQLQEQAWTSVNVFSLDYVVSQSFQLPLLEGAPSLEVLQKLRQHPAKDVLRDQAFQKKVKFIDGASVFIRIADARRDEELEPMEFTNTEYLPADKASFYMKKLPSQPIRTLIPQGKNPEQFQRSLAQRFVELIDKLIEDNDPYRLSYT
ncbi:uncharacterized protein LOC142342860 isoform X2 [Convolutriloba macropyga]|uniref:uncharacterized protein LOC142342860 isoform X2 n=1 Tax=Convolutriloba macropyga TaxID=536237 RepID=UPI003F528EC1